jgi:hypothetical protein
VPNPRAQVHPAPWTQFSDTGQSVQGTGVVVVVGGAVVVVVVVVVLVVVVVVVVAGGPGHCPLAGLQARPEGQVQV